MTLPSLSRFENLNTEQQYQYVMQAKANGLIGDNYSIAQVSELYKRDQLSKLNLDPDLDGDRVDTFLKWQSMDQLYKSGQLGKDANSLMDLYNSNPELAANLSDQLLSNGYMTREEMIEASKAPIDEDESTSWWTHYLTDLSHVFGREKGLPEDQNPEEFSKRSFYDYYHEVEKNKLESALGREEKKNNPEKFEQDVLEQARFEYLNARNKNIYADIQKQIENYQKEEAEKQGEINLQRLNEYDADDPEQSNEISAEFNKLVGGYSEQVTDNFGNNRWITHNGSNHWRQYAGIAFDDFGLDKQKETVALYQAYKDMWGPEKADQWLDEAMQTWVSEHTPWYHRAVMTERAFTNTIINNVIPRMLSAAVWGEAELVNWILKGSQAITGQEVTSNLFGDIASIISTGKDTQGRSPDDVDENGNPLYPEYASLSHRDVIGFGPLGNWGNLSFLRQDYLSKVDAYNTWDVREQERAEMNGGVSPWAQYTLKPGQSNPDFWSMGNVQDILGMTAQIAGQAAALWLYGGANNSYATLAEEVGKNGTRALLSEGAINTIAGSLKDAAITATPIAQSYAYGAYQQMYNGAMDQAQRSLEADALEILSQREQDPEWIAKRDTFYAENHKVNINPVNDGEVKGLALDNSNKRMFDDAYSQQEYQNILEELKKERMGDIQTIAQGAALDTYMTSYLGEFGKYGMLNAILNPLKVLKSPNQVLASELQTNAYGRLTQNAAGKFTNEGYSLLGIKKWSTTNPKVIGSYKVARNAIVSGGLSNYTDEMTTGFAMGYGLSEFNSEFLRYNNPEAYANTWHGGSAFGRLMDAIGEGITGAIKAGTTEQAWHAFEIGALGGIFAPRVAGKAEFKERYRQENAETLRETGKNPNWFKKFRQGFNTWVTGAVGEYEVNRFGMRDNAKSIEAYNRDIDERDELLTEVASLHQGIVNSATAAASNDFAATAAAQDALAMKLVYNEHSLSTNPLHRVSNQQLQTGITQLHMIAQGAVSKEEKERLVLEALNTSQTTKQGPITQDMKDKVWNDIQQDAKRMSDFINDYQEAEASLKEEDQSLAAPENYRLLAQKAELIAQEKRIDRDIKNISQKLGISVDFLADGVYGEMTDSQKKSLVKGAEDTIKSLEEHQEKEREKLKEAQDKLKTEEDEEKIREYEKEALQARANIKGIDRRISELRHGISSVNHSELLLSDNNLSTDAVVLDDMLSNPKQYSEAQQVEIEKFRAKIGPKGEVYVRELAKLTDQLSNNSYAQRALEENPEDFINFQANLAESRQNARNIAIYEQELQTRFEELRELPEDEIGIKAAVNLTPKQFKRFKDEHPDLVPLVEPYVQVNESFNTLSNLLDMEDKGLEQEVLNKIANLMNGDLEYIKDNGSQGVADMLEFIKAQYAANPVANEAIGKLLTDYKRAEAISQSTTAYTEHREKQATKRQQEFIEQMIESLEGAEQEEARRMLEDVINKIKKTPSEEKKEEPSSEEGPAEEKKSEVKTEEPEKVEASEEKKEDKVEEKQDLSEEPTQKEFLKGPEGIEERTEEFKKPPAGVQETEEGDLETMSAEEQAKQLGLTERNTESLIDDTKKPSKEYEDQQEEVHGSYFNAYDSEGLRYGELAPVKDGGPIYEWLSEEGIHLGNIIDDELNNILKVNPKIQLMKVKKAEGDARVANNVFLVVEYTDEVAKYHLPSNGGVIMSNNKPYLIVGTMWNTKAQNGTEAADLMLTTMKNLQRKGVSYFMSNPAERFFVDPDVHTEVTTFNSGHVISTTENGTSNKPLAELLDLYNNTHTQANQMDFSDLGFGVITMSGDHFYSVGPYDVNEIHRPQNSNVSDKYGQVYVLVPAANGEIVPIFINPTVLSEIKDGYLKNLIDNELIPKLTDKDYDIRRQAISDLCQLLCLSRSVVTGADGKSILIGTKDIPTVSLVNGKEVLARLNVNTGELVVNGTVINNSSLSDFRNLIYNLLNPRINLSLSNLADVKWVERYDEAGALTTDAVKLGTYGGKYYVSAINPATGQPFVVKEVPKAPVEANSDYSRAQYTPTVIPVGGKIYAVRNGRLIDQNTGVAITDPVERYQAAWQYRVLTGKATLYKREGPYDYYTMDVETDKPKVVVFDLNDRMYHEPYPEVSEKIISEQRAELEKLRADEAAKEALKQDTTTEEPVEESKTFEETREEPGGEDKLSTESSLRPNDFRLSNLGQQEKYSINDIIDSTEDSMMEIADRIYDIIQEKIDSGAEKWKDFKMENMQSELDRLGIQSTDIIDIESWIDNLKDCE